MFRTDGFSKVATLPVGKLPHEIWPSSDGTRVYVGIENRNSLVVIGTLTNMVTATVPIRQAPQAVNYVPEGEGTQGLAPHGVAGQAVYLSRVPARGAMG